jgi:small-conductance mechanosensitive channel
MNANPCIFYSLIILLFTISANAQNTNKKIYFQEDSTIQWIKRADSLRKVDSIAKQKLIEELEQISATETKKRKEVEAKLNALQQQDSITKERMKTEIDSLKKIAKGYPIAPYEDTLFFIFTKWQKISSGERAQLIDSRLKTTYEQYILDFDTLQLYDYGQTVDILFKDRTLINITDYDALWHGKSKMELASIYKQKIENDIVYYKENKSLLTLLKQITLVILVIFIQIILIKLINRFFKYKVDNWILKQKGTRIKGIKIKDYQFIDDDTLTDIAIFGSKIMRWALNLLQLYLTLPILFSIFPPTQRLAETLFGYLFSPVKSIGLSILNYLPDLFTIIVIIIATRYLIKFLRFLTNEIEEGNLNFPGFYPDWAKPTFNIIRFLVLAFMFVMIFPYLPGSESPVFQGVSVFLGIMFSLGSTSIIGNMVAGLVMTYMRPFKIGDRIKINDIEGDVLEKTPFVTRLLTSKNEYITIPNAYILSSSVLNYSTSKENDGMVYYTTVTLGYDIPWRQIHELLINAALKTETILKTPAPFVLQTSLDDFYVSYQLNASSKETNRQAKIYSLLHQNIQDVFFEAGVEILSPHYRAQRDGNYTTIPANYLPKNYQAPTFKVNNINSNGNEKF